MSIIMVHMTHQSTIVTNNKTGITVSSTFVLTTIKCKCQPCFAIKYGYIKKRRKYKKAINALMK